jgi:hypothetical protein
MHAVKLTFFHRACGQIKFVGNYLMTRCIRLLNHDVDNNATTF